MRSITIYAFPGFLLLIEYIFRSISGVDTIRFMGPTLASTGLGFLVGLLNRKDASIELSEELQNEIRDKKLRVILRREDQLTGWVLFFIFVLIAGWIVTLFLASRQQVGMWWVVPDFLLVGMLSYFVGVVFSVVKEAIA